MLLLNFSKSHINISSKLRYKSVQEWLIFTKNRVFLVLFCCFCSGVYSQELKFKLNPISKPMKIFNTINLSVEIRNNTDKPITIFANSFDDFGGVKKGGIVAINGKTSKLRSPGLDTNSGFKETNFVTLNPGSSRGIEGLLINLKEAGEYTVNYSFKQDPATINMKWAETSEAKKMAKTISKLTAEGTFTFNVAPAVSKTLVEKEITWEELKKKDSFNSIAEALANPSEAFKVTETADPQGGFDLSSVNKLAELKNLRSLRMIIGKEDVTLPNNFVEIPLMELHLLSRGGKINLPEGMFIHPTLRLLTIENVTNLPDKIGDQPFLTSLTLKNLDILTLPEWISELENLEHLSLSGLKVKRIPESFQKLTKLKKINCYKTEFEVLENIFNSTSLSVIKMSAGKLSSISSEVKNLKNCSTLSLDHNELTTIPKEVYEMSGLQELHLGYNKISQLPEGIEKLENLKKLVVLKNQLKSIPKGVLSCDKLKFFNGKNNAFSKKDKILKALKKKMKGKKYLMN